jgi:hypothetical protein
MSIHRNVSLLAQAEAADRVLVVPMGGVEFIPFSLKSSGGTRDLAGCSVVIVASQYGTIIAHIVPRPPTAHPLDTTAGDRNVQAVMNRVGEIYEERRNYFPSADTYSIFAVFDGKVALNDQKRIIEDKIESLGLAPFNTCLYITPRDPTNAGHGTAFVDSLGRGNRNPHVYVEDRLVSTDRPAQHGSQQGLQHSSQQSAQPSSQQSVQQSGHQTAQQTSNGWIWCSQYLRYYIIKDGQRVYAPAS